jgi:dTDP-4-amino-4,6-dideoxygalactose transaminase
MPSAAAENLPVARAAADHILCLPIFESLDSVDVSRITGLVRHLAKLA